LPRPWPYRLWATLATAETLPSSSRVIRIVSCVPQDPAKTVLILANRAVSTARRRSEAEPASALAIFRCRSSLPHKGTVCSTVYLTWPGAWGSALSRAARTSELGLERRIGEPPRRPDPGERRFGVECRRRYIGIHPASHREQFVEARARNRKPVIG
jgi:hypothetical protein